MSSATSIASMAQQLSRGFGIATVALLLHMSLAWRGESMLSLADFHVAFAGATLLALICLPFALPLPHHAGTELSGHGRKPAE
jgi:hypothetical protein